MTINTSDSIAVIGGGPMGLAVAYELCNQGLKPVLLEADDRLGGMAASFSFNGVQLERYYHFHCLTDTDFFKLLEELNLNNYLQWRQTSMGFFFDGRLYPWGTVGSVLSFRRLPLATKFRYLLHAARCLTIRNWETLDGITATQWLKQWLGDRGYQVLWHKLFAYKFYQFSDHISAAWIWSRVRRLALSRKKLKETLGYLDGGSQLLIDSIESAIKSNGATIHCNCPVQSIQSKPQGSGAVLQTPHGEMDFDHVISTIPIPLLAPILQKGGASPDLTERYAKQKSVACACVVLQTNCEITHNFWTNVNDSRFSIPGIIELSNLRPIEPHISYVPFYIPADHPDYQRSNQAFIEDAWDCLKAINPGLTDKNFIAAHCSRYRFAQPVCGTHFKDQLPPLEPFPGVITADTTAYYPEDRGISESIGFGRSLVRNLLKC